MVEIKLKLKGALDIPLEAETISPDKFAGKSIDMTKKDVVEPLRVKKQAIKSAVEATVMILRIDDVISSKGSGSKGGVPAMPPGGMGGMPPDMGGMY